MALLLPGDTLDKDSMSTLTVLQRLRHLLVWYVWLTFSPHTCSPSAPSAACFTDWAPNLLNYKGNNSFGVITMPLISCLGLKAEHGNVNRIEWWWMPYVAALQQFIFFHTEQRKTWKNLFKVHTRLININFKTWAPLWKINLPFSAKTGPYFHASMKGRTIPR